MNQFSRRSFLATSTAVAAVISRPAISQAADNQTAVKSISAMTFARDGKLIIADWVAGRLHAIDPPDMEPHAEQPFNVKTLSKELAKGVENSDGSLRVHALVFDSRTNTAIVAFQFGATGQTLLAAVQANGKTSIIDPSKHIAATFDISDAPPQSAVWKDTPVRSMLVTDLVALDDAILVAGIANADFSSTLRRVAYPFDGQVESTSVEMYHTVHNQIETRAPIRAMSVVSLAGQQNLVAAYTCTPLVMSPMESLFANNKVRAKTIAELGFGNTPMSMAAFTLDNQGEKSDWILIANDSKDADLISLDALNAASKEDGLNKPVKVPFESHAGVPTTSLPLTGFLAIRDQGPQFLVGLRRDVENGELEVVSIRKGAFFRLSDFVNEYDFESYRYPEGDPFQQQYIKPFHNMMKHDEGYDELVK